MSVGNASGMKVPALSLADADKQRQARRGLAVYLSVAVGLTALFDVLVFAFSPSWIMARMFAPAALAPSLQPGKRSAGAATFSCG